MNNRGNIQAMPPLPLDTEELRRVLHTRLRRRILYGRYQEDVRRRLRDSIGTVRESAWGPIDMTANPLSKVYSQLSGLYKRIPRVSPPPGLEDVAVAVAESGFWQLMQRVQRDTLALRECLISVSVRDGRPEYRVVYPDMVEAIADPYRPGQALCIKEWIKDENLGWVRVVTDIRDTPHYYAETEKGDDVSGTVLGSEGGYSGEKYPFQDNGEPFIPYVIYHAAQTGWLWDPYQDQEVVEGTLQLCVLYTFYSHVVRHAAWAQRWIAGARPAGMQVGSEPSRAEVVSDPATLLVLEPLDDEVNGQITAGQWSTPIDPGAVLDSIVTYERRLVDMAVGGSDVTKQNSDIRSGYSLAVSREAQMEAQVSFEPLFRAADTTVLRMTSALLGANTNTGEWSIHYRLQNKTAEQRMSEWELYKELIGAGMMSEIDAYMLLNPGSTPTEANAAINRTKPSSNTANPRVAPVKNVEDTNDVN